MILIGQYDSPFVRRIGIALTLYGIAFEHRPWSTVGDADRIRPYNPLTRVPTLVLDDGSVLVDSHSIVDHIDTLAPAGLALFPTDHGPSRRQAMRITALANGIADKAVALFYEKRMHKEVSSFWVERCTTQMNSTLAVLEQERAAEKREYWGGDRIGHPDIAFAAALRFLQEAHPGLIDIGRFPMLAAHAQRLEARPEFRAVQQTFIPPT